MFERLLCARYAPRAFRISRSSCVRYRPCADQRLLRHQAEARPAAQRVLAVRAGATTKDRSRPPRRARENRGPSPTPRRPAPESASSESVNGAWPPIIASTRRCFPLARSSPLPPAGKAPVLLDALPSARRGRSCPWSRSRGRRAGPPSRSLPSASSSEPSMNDGDAWWSITAVQPGLHRLQRADQAARLHACRRPAPCPGATRGSAAWRRSRGWARSAP